MTTRLKSLSDKARLLEEENLKNKLKLEQLQSRKKPSEVKLSQSETTDKDNESKAVTWQVLSSSSNNQTNNNSFYQCSPKVEGKSRYLRNDSRRDYIGKSATVLERNKRSLSEISKSFVGYGESVITNNTVKSSKSKASVMSSNSMNWKPRKIDVLRSNSISKLHKNKSMPYLFGLGNYSRIGELSQGLVGNSSASALNQEYLKSNAKGSKVKSRLVNKSNPYSEYCQSRKTTRKIMSNYEEETMVINNFKPKNMSLYSKSTKNKGSKYP